ncbi:MAG: O-antigen ligase family protein [Bdellovibrionales bacterium]|nr:O-antigen ligase family protein [Bdellovibrionales bacterium]
MAATEIVSWLFFVFTLTVLVKQGLKTGFAAQFRTMRSGLEIPLWGFILVTVIGLFVMVDDKALALDVAGSYRWIFLLYAYTYFFQKTMNPEWRKYLHFFAILMLAMGVFAVLQYFTGIEPPRSRSISFPRYGRWSATGFFNLPLTFAGVFGLFSFMMLGFSFHRPQDSEANYWWAPRLGAFIGWLGVIASLTRGAWLAMVAAIFTCFSAVAVRLGLLAMTVLVAIGGVGYFSSSVIQQRFDSIFSTKKRSNHMRLVIWKANIEMIKDYPILGVGAEQNNKYLLEYYPKVGEYEMTFKGHAHNNFLQVWATQGPIALLFFLWFSGGFVWLSWKLYRRAQRETFYWSLGLGLLASQVYFHISGLTECNFIDGEVNHVLVLYWGLLLAACHQLGVLGQPSVKSSTVS